MGRATALSTSAAYQRRYRGLVPIWGQCGYGGYEGRCVNAMQLDKANNNVLKWNCIANKRHTQKWSGHFCEQQDHPCVRILIREYSGPEMLYQIPVYAVTRDCCTVCQWETPEASTFNRWMAVPAPPARKAS